MMREWHLNVVSTLSPVAKQSAKGLDEDFWPAGSLIAALTARPSDSAIASHISHPAPPRHRSVRIVAPHSGATSISPASIAMIVLFQNLTPRLHS